MTERDKATRAQTQLSQMDHLIAVTAEGQIALLSEVGAAEDCIVACLVGQRLAYEAGKSPKFTMSVEELIAAGGLAQKLAKQTVYNTTSGLKQRKIIQKSGTELFVDERTVLQFFAARLPALRQKK